MGSSDSQSWFSQGHSHCIRSFSPTCLTPFDMSGQLHQPYPAYREASEDLRVIHTGTRGRVEGRLAGPIYIFSLLLTNPISKLHFDVYVRY